MTQLSPEPVAYYIYVAEHQNGYVVESLNDACDDLTNHNAVSTPLYTAPHPQFTPAMLQSVLDLVEIALACTETTECNCDMCSSAPVDFRKTGMAKLEEAIALLKEQK